MRIVLPLLLFLSTTLSAQEITVRQIASGLEMPVAITHAGDSRLFITTQRGQIFIHDGTQLLSTPFLDIRSAVLCCGERGLLGLAFHPRYKENGFFFVYFTAPGGDLTLARFRVSGDPNRADAGSSTILLRIPHAQFANHNGGQLAFGPDGYLYAGPGDGGSGGDPGNNAQTLTSLLGKLLRIDVDSGSPYAIPPTNPFANRNDARGEIWAYGLRNPWRFSFDRETGDLWIADVGQNAWEEVNVQPATSIGGENYGWRRMEGTHCFNPSANCQQPNITLPVIEYARSGGACSVTGGYRYRGARYARLRGTYVYGDYCSGQIWGALPAADGRWTTRQLFDATFRISSFGEDMNGELYVADYDGRVWAIEDTIPYAAHRRAVRR